MSDQEELADRIRRVLRGRRDVAEQRMFGGIAFMVQGHMACGTVRGSLMVRLGEAGAAAALKQPYVDPMDFTGKVLKTMAYVRPEGIRSDRDLKTWVTLAADFARSLPPNEARRSVRRSGRGTS
jgi:TfoX/Sxy family transcriptional regulator of competence genes